MGKISELPDELLVNILAFLPTKDAVSTSILSKQWELLWMWVPKLKYDICYFESKREFRNFLNKNLPLHRAPVIERFSLNLGCESVKPDDINMWVEITVSRSVRELNIHNQDYAYSYITGPSIVLPSSLYTCKSLATLVLSGKKIVVDVPHVVSLPSLKTLELGGVTYSNEDSLRLLLSYCLVLEDLVIKRAESDNLRELAVTSPSLQRLSLDRRRGRSEGGYLINTSSLKYFKLHDKKKRNVSYLIKQMPKLEEADIEVQKIDEKLLKSITFVKCLSLSAGFEIEESMYPAGIVFNQLEHLTLHVGYYWPKVLSWFVKDSPKLRGLHIYACSLQYPCAFSWKDTSVPKRLLESLESFKFNGYRNLQQRDFLSLLLKNVRCLSSIKIKITTMRLWYAPSGAVRLTPLPDQTRFHGQAVDFVDEFSSFSLRNM